MIRDKTLPRVDRWRGLVPPLLHSALSGPVIAPHFTISTRFSSKIVRIQGSGFRVHGWGLLRFRIQSLGFRSWFMVHGSKFKVHGSWFRAGLRVSGTGSRVSGTGHRPEHRAPRSSRPPSPASSTTPCQDSRLTDRNRIRPLQFRGSDPGLRFQIEEMGPWARVLGSGFSGVGFGIKTKPVWTRA